MQQADFNVEDFESRSSADKNVYVKFYVRPVPDEEATAKEGRPIYKDREYVEIRTPGQQNNVIQRPVTDMDRQRFNPAYRQFKAGEEEQVIGTPLSEVSWVTRSQVEELAHIRVRTLEHLASLGDDVCGRFAGLYKLKQRAQQAVTQAEKDAPFTKMQQENEDLRAKMTALENTVAEQSAIIKRLNTEKK